ncbi:unnamed protein product [Pleuronectes platessa]|uniref:Ubiquitin-like protease family profile domain-containing protein n=1 Tax=Pleuronectes platessa TaxID=8262 RepID=A0A9N7ZEV1_PLEPL|nr:unnamed protein product [Pleuronectes platessa]
MVHSGSASPMKTSPTASPHLTAPATAPPLQVAPPLVPPPRDTSGQGLTQTPAKHLSTDPTSIRPPQPSTPSPADAEPPVVTPALTSSSSPASSWSSTQTTTPAQGPFNGRTSGRKRTPKACDCCGPNSKGHNVKNSGRGRGRGRGAVKDLWDTPNRKVGAQLTLTNSSDLTKEMGEEAEDENDTYEKEQTTSMVAHSLEENKDAQMDHGVQSHPTTFKSPFCNGDTVNLTDSESEEEANLIMSELGNGLLSKSRQSSPASRSTPMEVETSPCPITVDGVQHHWALGDHRLYCQPGTWEKKQMEEVSGKDLSEEEGMDVKMSNEENLERLTDMVNDFLESFYIKYGSFIPLTETDVLEHLKKNGKSDFSKWGLDIKREMTRYRSSLASAPVAGFMVMYNKHSLGLEDLGTLEEQNWLNDQIINMYGELIMEATQHKVHFFNSFFHKQLVAKGYDGVKRWTKKVDLFSKWLLLIPIHLEIHWSLVTVTMATKTISYYDSQGIVFRHTTDNIMKYLQSEAREKEQTAFQKGWKITIIKGIPQQRNDSDCGVFVLEYCRRLSVRQPLLFSQEDMPLIRKRIYKEMCDCRLND